MQIPDPFLKNVLFKANDDLFRLVRESGIEIGFKDLGGGGFTCATSEMGSAGGFGMEINLDDMHKAGDFPAEVLSIAETQERFLIVSPPELREKILKIYNEDWDLPNVYEGARASVVGKINTGDRFTVTHKGEMVCDVPIQHLTEGIRYNRLELPRTISLTEPDAAEPTDYNEVLLKILRSPNIASREHVYRYYDTEVMGNAVIRPGEADAGLIAPVRGEKFGLALAVDSNPFYGRISPYWGGATAVAEAMRNVAAIGAVPSTLTDCLNYGNPEKPEAFWEFREGVKGLAESCKKLYLKGYEDQQQPVPIVSGNVSFYNESPQGSVDPSPVVACVGIMKDFSKAITMDLKKAGDKLFLIGPRFDELGGSEYYRTILGVTGANVPIVRFDLERNMIYAVIDAIEEGLLAAAHDISNGGLAASLCEMALTRPARFGVELDLDFVQGGDIGMRTDKLLFSESSGFVLEAKAGSEARLVELLKSYNLEPMQIGISYKQETDCDVKSRRVCGRPGPGRREECLDGRPGGGDEMKIAVLQFPGTNCEFETLVAVKEVGMDGEIFRWNRPAGELSGFDGFVIPGGFSYQDRLRAGVIASKEPVMSALKEEACKGKPIIGICNGFQILVETGLLPGNVNGNGRGEQRVVRKGQWKGGHGPRPKRDGLPGKDCAERLLLRLGKSSA